ncbi:protein SUPPRESSOR OF K(+) TRANSPORT GROWTH DEFECT 1-like [Primulina eburnea]|uniref:protein SUPPRESSOR OF K(+) TRANSPORT GROWTH DEFECT 1-like n=1 Tax=Primulina eburnea TaxID=1245227 RepID=UPI003C6C8ACB
MELCQQFEFVVVPFMLRYLRSVPLYPQPFSDVGAAMFPFLMKRELDLLTFFLLYSVNYSGVGHNDDKVLVLAATITPYALDQAIRQRFDNHIYISLPELKARRHMFKVYLGDTPHNLTESVFKVLAHKTKGFSGSDISVYDVLFEPVRKTQDAMFFIETSDGTWIPCGPKQPGVVQITMQKLAAKVLERQTNCQQIRS